MYYYRLRHVRNYAARELVPMGWAAVETETEPEALTKSVPSTPPGWKDVAGAGTLRIEIGKCSIIANQETDAELLGKVCRALAELC